MNEVRQQSRDEWEVNRSSLIFVRKLGAGQFADVWEGLWKNKTRVAVKTHKFDLNNRKEFLAEAEILKKLRHPNIIQLFGVCTAGEPFYGLIHKPYIITEIMKYGSLCEYLKGKGKKLKFQKLIDMAARIASGMAYVGLQNYVHCDLAARNILVTVNNIVKTADFGSARSVNGNEARVGGRVAIRCTAPEAVYYCKFSIKSDVWSFGILLTELVSYGRTPYSGMTNADVLSKIKHGLRMVRPQNCTQPLYDIMLECWHEDPMQRPTFETLQSKLEDFYKLDP